MKSQESILLNLLTALLLDAERAVQGYSSNRDISELRNRLRHNGVSFVTITLPTLDDYLLGGLSSGSVQALPGWKKKKGFNHPEFLHGLWMRIFYPSGCIVPDPNVEAIIFIRQITRLAKKISEVCDQAYVDAAITAFVESDREIGRLPVNLPYPSATEVAHAMFGSVIGSLFEEPATPKHGPGAVAERLGSVSKYSFDTLSPRIVEEFGVDPFRYSFAEMENPRIAEVPARLIAVAKTATKPRLIAIEPSYNQFIQQGFQTKLESEMSKSSIWSYDDQVPNQELARIGSISGNYSTIDLSEASDRVSWGYVQQMFSFNRGFVRMLANTRSVYIDVPGYGTRVLHKFASMGSSLTFPVEIMYFSVIIGVSIGRLLGDYRPGPILRYLRNNRIRVYGDDLIVPTELTQILIQTLEQFGLKVNTSKSFWTGGFRESCGADWYNGFSVQPVYLRRWFPDSVRQVTELVSLASFRDQLYNRHLFEGTVRYLDGILSRLGAVEVPPEYSASVGVVIRRPGASGSHIRWNTDLQRFEVRCRVLSHKRLRDHASDSARLFKSLYEGLSIDPLHLELDARPVSATLKYRWVGLVLD